ncbi:homoprotocatechuate degradation operon regulator HpaR [Chromobacterium haemolyticum]|uniref:Homoprotocatechuate degradation operon regulator, HpaR n=1 Tax=Chromobacterium haemolyticum TaxID=394935 RepID=A0A1W0CAU8_9NEIS|nr:homoprotocatechuate degradation operon regulator, HpaR [Chromobacterium haemolyticum]
MIKINIKQRSLQLPLQLLRARESVIAHFRPIYRHHKITEQQWRILQLLQDFGTQKTGNIANQVCILPPSLTRMLDLMEKVGLIHRHRALNDRRSMLISLSPKGRKLVRVMSPILEDQYLLLQNHLGQEKMTQLHALLDDLERLSPPHNDPPPLRHWSTPMRMQTVSSSALSENKKVSTISPDSPA